MIVIFDRQHYGKPGRSDMGAGYDIDADGVVENQEREANLTMRYIEPAIEELKLKGIEVHLLDSGWYPNRHAEANNIARQNPGEKVAYLACHVNAGKGDYMVCLHDSRSQNGRGLANYITKSAQFDRLPDVRRFLVRPASATNDWKRGYSCIRDIYLGPPNICGVVFEPYFIDQPAHAYLSTAEGGEVIAESLVTGLECFDNGWDRWRT